MTRVWDVQATTNAIMTLADQLAEAGIQRVVVESTSDYWRSFLYSGKTGKGNRYLKGVLGEAAAAAARTDTFLGQRYKRLIRRRGKGKALVAVARSILIICWHLLADPAARYNDLGSDFYDQHLNNDRKTRNLVRQLQALGHQVTLTAAA